MWSQVSCRRRVADRPESTSRARPHAPAARAEPPAALNAKASIEVKQLTQMPPDSTGATARRPLTATVAPMPENLRWGIVAVGALLATAPTVCVAVAGQALRAEVVGARALHDLPTWSTTLLRWVMQVGTRGAIIVAVAALVVVGRRHAALVVGVSGTAAWFLARLLKEIVDRPRPSVSSLARPLREVVEGPGFPSTHAAVAFAVAIALVLAMPMPRIVAASIFALAVLTAVARVHLGVHWPLDVIGGGGVGLAMAGFVSGLLDGRSHERADSR